MCDRTIADFADYVSPAEKAAQQTHSYAVERGQRWPQLVRAMQISSASWRGNVPEKTCLAVLALDELQTLGQGPELAMTLQSQGLLSQQELERLRSFTHAKRQKEWLGGRLAAKYSLLQYSGWKASELLPAALSIANDNHGRPFLEPPHPCGFAVPGRPHLSLSHSGSFAAALAASAPCGLDIQQIDTKLQRLQARFASPAELALGGAYEALIWLAMLWTAKEAVKKCCYYDQPTFMDRVRVIGHRGCATASQGAALSCQLNDGADAVSVRVNIMAGYAMAMVLGGQHA